MATESYQSFILRKSEDGRVLLEYLQRVAEVKKILPAVICICRLEMNDIVISF